MLKVLTTFFATSALDTAYLHNEMSRRQTKMLVSIIQSTMRLLKLDLLSVTYYPEMAEICSVIVTHASAAITLQPSNLKTCVVVVITRHTNVLA